MQAKPAVAALPTVSSPSGFTLSRLWLFAAVAVPAVSILGARISTIDLAYQIRAGEIMLGTRRLLDVDVFSFTAEGRPWLNQQWGAQVLLALAFRAGGWAGIALLRAALVSLAYSFLYLSCRAAGSHPRRAAIFTMLGFAGTFPGLGVRPQLFGIFLFTLSAWLLAHRREWPRAVWAVTPMIALWTNLHGSFIVGGILILLAWIEDLRDRRAEGRRTLALGVASLAATLLNPYGLRVWEYVVSLPTNATVAQTITEWQAPTIRDPIQSVFVVSLLAVAGLLIARRVAVPWPTLLRLGVFAVIGLYAIRGMYWWGFTVVPVLAGLFPGTPPRRVEKERPAPNVAIAASLVALGFVFFWRFLGEDPRRPSPSLVDPAPPGITDAVRRALPPGGHMFNPQLWGSWLEFALPDRPVFVDSRIELFETSVWKDYDDISVGREGWQGLLDRWGITVVILNPIQQSDLIPQIERDPGWRLHYRDRDGLVFLRVTD